MKNICKAVHLQIFKNNNNPVIFIVVFLITSLCYHNSFSYVVMSQVKFAPNNISTWIQNTGTFNQDIRTNNTPGFEWPKGFRKFALFTSGLSIGAFVNGNLRLATASYSGEYAPGYVMDSLGYKLFKTDSRFRLYTVRYNDTYSNNIDYAEWKNMVPYGAPYKDVNNNGAFDDLIDKPGVEDAIQTVFICLTDADPSTHSNSAGFSGGTIPLKAEVHLTAWGYDIGPISNVQYFKWVIINKNDSAWNKAYFGIYTDPDLGDASDDYIGTDTTQQMMYCYNADNADPSYGANPPAVGQSLIRGAIVRNGNTIDSLKAICITKVSKNDITCDRDPSHPLQAYSNLSGFKIDGTPWLNPLANPYTITKFTFTGNPEDSSGWTERKGYIRNCGGQLTGEVVPSAPPGDRRMFLSTGSDMLYVNPGDTQKIVMAQFVARGSSNLNSVTQLKETARLSRHFYYVVVNENESQLVNEEIYLPNNYVLRQNYPNPFNPFTTIRYEMKKLWKVKIQVYDTRGELISTLVNEEKPQGKYEIQFDASGLPSGVYFVKMSSGGGFEDSKKMVIIK